MKRIQLDDFTRIKYLSNPTFSPNGKNLCFTLTETDKEKNEYHSYLYCRKDGELFKLTSFGKESRFFFLDDDTVLFGSNRDKNPTPSLESKFYRISLNGGEAEECLTFPIGISSVKPLKNGKFLLTGMNDPEYPDLYKGKKEYNDAYQKRQKDNADYEELKEVPFYFNGMGFTRGMRSSLYLYDPEKKKLKKLTPNRMNVGFAELSPNEDFVLLSGNTNQGYLDFFNSDLYKLDLTTGKLRKILNHKTLSVSTVKFADSFIYVLGNTQDYGMNTNDDVYTMDYETLTLKKLMDYGESFHSSVGSDVRYGGGRGMKVWKDDLYFVTTLFDKAVLKKISDGKLVSVIDKDGSIDSFDLYDGKLAMVALYDMKPQELYDEKLNAISNFNGDFLKDKYVAVPEELNFQSVEDEIHGFVLKPFNYKPGKKYPVIFDIHGGPKTVYGKVFYHEMQYWCSEGYFVIYCNPTGSDGRGNAFMCMNDRYGKVDYEDLMNFVDAALKAYPDMDADNLYETGGSYGGFMTNWIIGHTDRFRACASQRSISNWVSFYGVSDIGVGFTEDQQDGTPFRNLEKLWWHSPLKYAQNVKTPTLFIHSNEDYRCPMEQGMQMYTAIRVNGVDSKLVYFKGENHELSRSGKPLHRIKRLDEITNWFKSHKK